MLQKGDNSTVFQYWRFWLLSRFERNLGRKHPPFIVRKRAILVERGFSAVIPIYLQRGPRMGSAAIARLKF